MTARNTCRFIAVAMAALVFGGCQSFPQNGLSPSRTALSTDSAVRFQDSPTERTDPRAFSYEKEDAGNTAVNSADEAAAGDQQALLDQARIVKQVIVKGNQTLPDHQILRHMRTRPGRYLDPDLLQEDVNQLWRMKAIRRVNGPLLDYQPDGINVIFEVSERPYMSAVRYIGNRAITDKALSKETGLKDGDPMDMHSVRMAKTAIEEMYQEKGYPRTEVTIVSGDELNDREVVFLIHEDELQRVSSVSFEGNTVASDARLKTFLKMKPGVMWVFGGKVNRRELEQDEMRIMSYYRSLGYFNARIGRELNESDDGRWLGIRYVINEGPRYRIRNVSFTGNEKYSTDQLASVVKLRGSGGDYPEFNSAKMNEDQKRLTDLYGSEGFVFADIKASPVFLEEPGLLDLVYQIEEGEQYRVGNINVVIDGEYGITKRQVVLNRMGLRPGDIIDTRLLNDAEARLARSQLFEDGISSPGPGPRVVVKPPEIRELEEMKTR
jgi:outer membrane protein insertion porin family